MGDPTETILNLVLIGGALFIGGTVLIPMLGKLAVPAAGATPPPAVDANGNPVVTPPATDANGNPVTPPATTPPASTGNPILDLLNQLLGGGATTPPAGTPAPAAGGGANPSLCHSKYFGKCDTECKGGNSSNCQNCRIACGLSANLAMADDIYDDEDMPMPVGYYVTMG